MQSTHKQCHTSGISGVGSFMEKKACKNRNRVAERSQGPLRGTLLLRTKAKTCGEEQTGSV